MTLFARQLGWRIQPGIFGWGLVDRTHRSVAKRLAWGQWILAIIISIQSVTLHIILFILRKTSFGFQILFFKKSSNQISPLLSKTSDRSAL